MKKLFIATLLTITSLQLDAQYGAADTAALVKPFKIFDNLYYAGNAFVSAYFLTTDKGIVLIDAMYGKFVKDIPVYCKQLGLDLKNIKYIICTHGHYDHCEGADIIKSMTGAKVGMLKEDWDIADGTTKAPYTSVTTLLKRDWTINDGDSLVMGNTVLKFYRTPGHTTGTLSIAFPVRDGNNTYKAFMFGGVGLNFDGVERTEMYLASVDRIMAMKGIQVNITNHPGPGKIFERAALLNKRKAGEPHPFVAPDDFQSWLVDLRKGAEKKLAEEKAKASR